MAQGRPLPLEPVGAVEVVPGVQLLETEEGGAVFLYGMATWCWEAGDLVGRRLAAVQLAETKAALPAKVAAAFGVEYETLRRWRHRWQEAGTEGLVSQKTGMKGPYKLTDEVRAEIATLRAEGLGLRAIARGVGLDPSTVRRGLPTPAAPEQARQHKELEPLARPRPRDGERALARAGLLCGAEPVICEGASLPFAGALLVLPALAATGLLEIFEAVFSTGRAAFYSIRALVLSLVCCLILGEPRAEGLSRIDPVDVGRLLGLDRAPEVKTLRRRLEELAGLARSDEVLSRLAARHLDAVGEACGFFYVDGHVRAYHGAARLPKAHLARARLAAPAEVDTWICDQRGDGVLVWTTAPGASLVGELQRAAAEIRALVGEQARPTIVFDRGGYSPRLFAELHGAGFHILTYDKAPKEDEPHEDFSSFCFTDDLGRDKTYLLADRETSLSYKVGKKACSFACRKVTRLDEASGHQTPILTTLGQDELPAPAVAYAMFSRWREENFFRYERLNYGLDALDSHTKRPDDLTRLVPNPARRAASDAVRQAKAAVSEAEARLARDTLEHGSAGLEHLEEADATLEAAVATRGEVPARVPLGSLHPDAARLHGERKRLHDAVRMATYNATSSLARLLAPHYSRAEDEARMLVREALRSPADLEIAGDELHVRLNALSAPRRSRAIAAICHELNTTETLYPGTKLRLVYSVKGF